MSSDSGVKQPEAPKPDFELPNVVDLSVRRIRFRPRKPRNFESVFSQEDEAVEFVVSTDAPIPVRALGPALYVGQTAVVESEEVEPNVYRFLAFDDDGLRKRAAISLGWSGDPDTRRRTTFRYEPPEE
jgi:hypothetical protein